MHSKTTNFLVDGDLKQSADGILPVFVGMQIEYPKDVYFVVEKVTLTFFDEDQVLSVEMRQD